MMYIANGKERCVILASYLVENQSTVRAVASKFGISKSTVHKDITQMLKHVDLPLYDQVQDILEKKQERAPYQRRRSYEKQVYAAQRTELKPQKQRSCF